MKIIRGTFETDTRRAEGGTCLPMSLVLTAEETAHLRAALEGQYTETPALAEWLAAQITEHLGDLAHRGARRLATLELERAGALEVHRASHA